MIIGGQLTSILVCQKCKHISRTYEDFNDISLSIKPEDYAHRKRNRLKNFAKCLTTFPSSSSSSSSTTKPLSTVQRPSSVPPTSTSREQREVFSVETHDDATSRRSLDLPTERGEDTDTSSLVTSKEEEGDSDNSHVLVNAMGLEDKHVNFVDVQRGGRRTRRRRGLMDGRRWGGGSALRLVWGNFGIGRVDRWRGWGC